jgi:hypothetical protein
MIIVTAVILIAIHIGIVWAQFYGDVPIKSSIANMFNLDMESNLPTFFSSAILMLSALLFYLLSKTSSEIEMEHRSYWLGLSFVFFFLSIDESAKIHEAVGDLIDSFVHSSGYLDYPWLIPYAILVLVLILFYIRFFWHMERKVFREFAAAAVIYLSGAIGFELLGAKEASSNGTDTLSYAVCSTLEESMEMIGVIILIHILLKLLEGKSFTFDFRL